MCTVVSGSKKERVVTLAIMLEEKRVFSTYTVVSGSKRERVLWMGNFGGNSDVARAL